jgi:hypothetical protein
VCVEAESEEFKSMALVYKLNDSRVMDKLSDVSHQLHDLSEQVPKPQTLNLPGPFGTGPQTLDLSVLM